jgi:NH3-dependent NAD+ synthetase
VAAGLPFAGILKSLGHRPETLGIKARLWVTLLVGKDTWETPVVMPLEVDVPVPYDQIDVYVEKRKKQLEDDAADNARKAAKEALPSVKVPRL